MKKIKIKFIFVNQSHLLKEEVFFFHNLLKRFFKKIIQKSKNEKVIVSNYIMNPLLINNLKFDLRIYVAIISIDPLKIYVYKEGLTRFATEPFKVNKNNFNKYVHLTNFSINKNNKKFFINSEDAKKKEGFKWSLETLKKKLTEMKIDHNLIFNQIEDILIKTVLSIEQIMFTASQKHLNFQNNCFELLGFDILVDSNLKPWLVEVNRAPSLSCGSDLDFDIKSNLIKDLFNLSGIYPKITKKGSIFNRNINLSMYNSHRLVGKKDFERKLINKIIVETYEEVKRSGDFKLIYPSYNCLYYSQFFEEKRPKNEILLKM